MQAQQKYITWRPQQRFSILRMFMKPVKITLKWLREKKREFWKKNRNTWKKKRDYGKKKREFCPQDTKYVKELGVGPEELSEIAENCEVFRVLLGLLSRDTLETKAGVKMNKKV